MGTDESSELLRLPDGRHAQLWQGGAAAGPAVLLFHGCPDSRLAACSGEAAARHAGVHLVAVNRPGYGRSDPHESDHGTVADDTVAVADLLGIDRFAVLGMSVGGPYALACAARHPGRVTSVGVVAAPAVVPELDPPRHRDDLTPEQQAFFARLAGGTVADAVEQLHPQDAEQIAGLPSATVAEGVREALARSSGYLRDAARWLAERIPDTTLVVRPGTAHLAALLGHWDEILRTLRPVG